MVKLSDLTPGQIRQFLDKHKIVLDLDDEDNDDAARAKLKEWVIEQDTDAGMISYF